MNRTRAMSLTRPIDADTISQVEGVQEEQRKRGNSQAPSDDPSKDRTKARTESVLSRFRSEAFKRLKDLEKAEDAADEALLKFGTNLRNFLHEAVQIAPPSDTDSSGSKDDETEVLNESKDQEGKRVIHTTRFEAQLHVIHTRIENFLEDPNSPEYSHWKESFDVDKKTDQIAMDLDRYRDLRLSMERLVPDQASYQDFWTRYYFLRQIIEEEEARRKDIMKGRISPLLLDSVSYTEDEMLKVISLSGVSADSEDDVAWDEDSDTETTAANPGTTDKEKDETASVAVNDTSTATLHPPLTPRISTSNKMPADSTAISASSAKVVDPRSSNDQHSLPDSDSTYDVVSGAPSGAPSHGPGSPSPEVGVVKDMAKGATVTSSSKTPSGNNESDEEDWE